jgi:hypothetical protein
MKNSVKKTIKMLALLIVAGTIALLNVGCEKKDKKVCWTCKTTRKHYDNSGRPMTHEDDSWTWKSCNKTETEIRKYEQEGTFEEFFESPPTRFARRVTTRSCYKEE